MRRQCKASGRTTGAMLATNDPSHTPPLPPLQPPALLPSSRVFAAIQCGCRRRRCVKAAAPRTLSGTGPEWACAIKVSEAPGGPADPPRLSGWVGGSIWPPGGGGGGGRGGGAVLLLAHLKQEANAAEQWRGGCKQRERLFDLRSHDPQPPPTPHCTPGVRLTHINSSRPALVATEDHQGLGPSTAGQPI